MKHLWTLPATLIMALASPSQSAPEFSISPAAAPSDQSLNLTLHGSEFDCGTEYSQQTVAVSGDEIQLTILAVRPVDSACPLTLRANEPLFNLPALKSGIYKVQVYLVPDCYPCRMFGRTYEAGYLAITNPADRVDWYLGTQGVAPDQAFDLKLLNSRFGNCQTRFTHPEMAVGTNPGDSSNAEPHSLFFSFLPETDTTLICIQDIRPFGPTFTVQGLPSGIYPVFVTELMPCEIATPRCYPPVKAPMAIDTLVVMRSLTLSLSTTLSRLRASAPAYQLLGGRLTMKLPEGRTGLWRSEVVAPNGSLLAESRVFAAGGALVVFNLELNSKTGFSLVRLVSPDGVTQILPLAARN